MAEALARDGNAETTETSRFFNLMNVRSLSEAVKERNPNKEPYRSSNDSRLEVTV